MSEKITLWKNYSKNSHVVVGDFKNTHSNIRLEKFRSTEGINFNGKLYVGAGWLFRKNMEEWMKSILSEYSIEYEEKEMNAEILKDLKEKRKEEIKMKNEMSCGQEILVNNKSITNPRLLDLLLLKHLEFKNEEKAEPEQCDGCHNLFDPEKELKFINHNLWHHQYCSDCYGEKLGLN